MIEIDDFVKFEGVIGRVIGTTVVATGYQLLSIDYMGYDYSRFAIHVKKLSDGEAMLWKLENI
jgi:hypothetical protein